ncbi:hypothetical protein ASE75_08435 [Sphingomonas sp. Leaf17]|uniref:TonB-dependent receptor plug domain-containing protein n=1 Tax=Sphingomonas sp. Leaf17 TaxID=1735683 RepID=UPI0006F84FBB|nr:TonB-dependent receptor plug domain-containing protein [Sphingomonas sp. Leaf17]KQM65063.1 hypothetical protein ASE75_08435 [Sphingomonas sp. Leaf17]
MRDGRSRRYRLVWLAGGLIGPAPTLAQDRPPAAPDEAAADTGDIVVTGQRLAGSAIGDIAPIAVLDETAIRSVGATSLKELLDRLKPLTDSAGGGDPVILLNGRRMSGFGDLYSLPPEAMERTEVLSETEAARFGYPPTVKVLNFITKTQFRGATVQLLPGTTTEGGGETHFGAVTAARIDGPRRVSISVSHLRLNPVVQGERDITPDPDAPGSAASAPYRSLQQRSDRVRVDGTVASPIGKAVDASLNLSMEAQRSRGFNGLAPLTDGTYQYRPDALLRQRTTDMTLHAGGIVQGGIRRWGWSVTSAYDRVRNTALSEQAASVPVAGDVRDRFRSATVTDTVVTKAVVTGPAFAVPAGDVQVTVALDHARSTSRDAGGGSGTGVAPRDLRRTTRGGSINAALPITAPGQGALGFLGRMGATGTVGLSDVSAYGRLASASYGLTWAPVRAVQLTALASDGRTPPAIALLTDPLVSVPNTPFFDFTTGVTVPVTAVLGGNPALVPERRRITQLGA